MFVIPYGEYQPHYGGFLVCANCGRENDFISLIRVVKRKTKEIAEEHANAIVSVAMSDMKKQLQKACKGNKFLKIC